MDASRTLFATLAESLARVLDRWLGKPPAWELRRLRHFYEQFDPGTQEAFRAQAVDTLLGGVRERDAAVEREAWETVDRWFPAPGRQPTNGSVTGHGQGLSGA